MIVERDMFDHPKTVKLARRLAIPQDSAVVLMQRLWGHCEARRTGFLGSDPEDVAAISRFPGKSKVLISALLDCVWVEKKDGGFVAHGWEEVNASWLAKVRGGKDRAASARRGKDGKMASASVPPPASSQPATSTPPAHRQLAGEQTASCPPASSQLAGFEAGAVEWSGVENPPIVPLRGTASDLGEFVQIAIDRLCTLFPQRKKKRVGASARFALEALAMDGTLPLSEEDWAALTRFYAERGEHPKEKLWRLSPEMIAENLLSETDKAKTWLTTQGIGFSTAKKEGGPPVPEPVGWREWLAKQYPSADAPATFPELPVQVRTAFLTRRQREEAA